jgi:hypothetical protein
MNTFKNKQHKMFKKLLFKQTLTYMGAQIILGLLDP